MEHCLGSQMTTTGLEDSRLKLTSRVLGSGSFANVLRGELEGVGLVAVKMLLPSLCDPQLRQFATCQRHFKREAELLIRLNHPNVLHCYGLVLLKPSHPGMPHGYRHPALAMVLELCEGGSVANMVYKQMIGYSKLYTDLDALQWMTEAAHALHYLHTLPHPGVHRDVKPDNIMLAKVSRPAKDGGGHRMVAKLADFGLHVVIDQDERVPVLRQRGMTSSRWEGQDVAQATAAAAERRRELSPRPSDAAAPDCHLRVDCSEGAAPSMLRLAKPSAKAMRGHQAGGAESERAAGAFRGPDAAHVDAHLSGDEPQALRAVASMRSLSDLGSERSVHGLHAYVPMASDGSRAERSVHGLYTHVPTATEGYKAERSVHGLYAYVPIAPEGSKPERSVHGLRAYAPVASEGLRAERSAHGLYAHAQVVPEAYKADRSAHGLLCPIMLETTRPAAAGDGGEIGRLGAGPRRERESGQRVPASVLSQSRRMDRAPAPCGLPGTSSLMQLPASGASLAPSHTAVSHAPMGTRDPSTRSRADCSGTPSKDRSAHHGPFVASPSPYLLPRPAPSGALGRISHVTVAEHIMRVGGRDSELAFVLTGATGSAIYMSPEVYLQHPYNEKVDVFGFGVVLYEVFARIMIISMKEGRKPETYAAMTADGFRQARPHRMDPELYKLMEWCWRQDPNERPMMKDVIACLDIIRLALGLSSKDMQAGGHGRGAGTQQGCGCVVS